MISASIESRSLSPEACEVDGPIALCRRSRADSAIECGDRLLSGHADPRRDRGTRRAGVLMAATEAVARALELSLRLRPDRRRHRRLRRASAERMQHRARFRQALARCSPLTRAAPRMRPRGHATSTRLSRTLRQPLRIGPGRGLGTVGASVLRVLRAGGENASRPPAAAAPIRVTGVSAPRPQPRPRRRSERACLVR